MIKNCPLSKILLKLYEENSRYEINPPIKIMKELEQNILVIADMEVSEEDIPILMKFLNHKETIRRIERIQVNKSSGGKVNQRRTTSALSSSNYRLFRELLHFIVKCKHLHSISFESVDISVDVLPHLGKALATSASDIRWLGFHACTMCSDEGVHILTPFLSKMRLQVLGIEQCDLTDRVIPYITSILKAQENYLDSLYWNSTLRLDPTDDNGTQLEKETDHVYACGLVALSLSGNNLTGKGVLPLTRVLRKNYWLLGLNLADNQLNAESLQTLVSSLQTNATLQTLLLRGNTGLPISLVMPLLRDILARNTNTVSPTSAVLPLQMNSRGAEDDDAGSEVAKCNGYKRLRLMPDKVAQLLRLWMRLHGVESDSSSALFDSDRSLRDSGNGGEADFSFLTLSTTQSKKRYQKSKGRDGPPRRQDSAVSAAYSVLYFLDSEIEPPTSYRQDRLSSSSSVNRSALKSSATDMLLRSPPRPAASSRQQRYSEENAVEQQQQQLFRGDGREDPLQFAVPPPTHSPPRQASPLMAGMSAHMRLVGDEDEDEVERQSWDNSRLWPTPATDLPLGSTNREERPPSRMSLRPVVEHEDVNASFNRRLPLSNNYMRDGRPPSGRHSKAQREPHYLTARNSSPNRSKSAPTAARWKSVGVKSTVSSNARMESAMMSPTRGRSAVFGKAARDTRMQQRQSVERPRHQNTQSEARRYYRDHSDARTTQRAPTVRRKRSAVSKRGIQDSSLEESRYISTLDQHVLDLTHSMHIATRNLEAASAKLQNVSESLNESMHHQQQNSFNNSQSQSLFHDSVGNQNFGSATKQTRPNSSPSDRSGFASGVATYLMPSGDSRGRPTNSAEKALQRSSPQSLNGSRRSVNRSDLNGFSSFIADSSAEDRHPLEESDLAEMVRARLYSRLEEMLTE